MWRTLVLAFLLGACRSSIVQPFTTAPIPAPVGLPENAGPALILEAKREIRFLDEHDPLAGYRRRESARILVTSREGLGWGRVRFFLGDEQRLISVRARSHPATGNARRNLFEIEPDAIAYVEYADSASVLYSTSRMAMFDVPGVSVGDVIEYEIEIEVPGSVSIPPWIFNAEVPVVESTFSIGVPHGWKLSFAYAESGRFTDRPPEVREEAGRKECVWVASNLPAMSSGPDAAPPSQRTRAIWVSVQNVYPEWRSVADWYQTLTSALDVLEPGEVPVLDDGLDGDPGRRWFRFVRDRVRYLAYYREGLDGFRPHAAPMVLKSGYGDCKDMATLLVALYRRAGLEAFTALVSTSDELLFPDRMPTPAAFNHAVVALPRKDGTFLFVDPTDKDLPYGSVPWHLAGKYALVVRGEKSALVRISETPPAQNRRRVAWELAASGDAAELEIESRGELSRALRRQLRARGEAGLPEVLQDGYLSVWSGATIASASAQAEPDRIVVRAQVRAPETAWSGGDELVYPLARFFPRPPSSTEVPRDIEIVVSIPRAAGARVVHVPESLTVESDGVRVRIQAEVEEERIRVSYRIEVRAARGRWKTAPEIEEAVRALHREAVVLSAGDEGPA